MFSSENLRDSYKCSSRSNKKSNGLTYRKKSHIPMNTLFREEYQKLPCKKPGNHLIKVTNTNVSNSNSKAHVKLIEFNNRYGITAQETLEIPVYSLNKKKRWEMSHSIKKDLEQSKDSDMNVQVSEKDILRSQKIANLFKPMMLEDKTKLNEKDEDKQNKEIMKYEIGLASKKTLLKNGKVKNEKKLNKSTKRENYYSRKIEYDDFSDFSSSDNDEDVEAQIESVNKMIQTRIHINILDLIE